jgi:hypothetical protein
VREDGHAPRAPARIIRMTSIVALALTFFVRKLQEFRGMLSGRKLVRLEKQGFERRGTYTGRMNR